METGRAIIPSHYATALADALGYERSPFPQPLLQHTNPFMLAALFGDDAAFELALSKLTAAKDEQADDPRGSFPPAVLPTGGDHGGGSAP